MKKATCKSKPIYSTRNRTPRLQITFPAIGRTEQHFREECNINNILAKYQKTGAITHFAKHSPTYGDYPAIDYREAIELVREAESSFNELPSSIRKEFDNDPASFLNFVQNPANKSRMDELGLTNTRPKGVSEKAFTKAVKDAESVAEPSEQTKNQ